MHKRSLAVRTTCAATALLAVLFAGPARADLVLLGSDYFETIQPTFFAPLGPLNPLAGLPLGPGSTDTIVQRRGDCALSLATAGSQCTIAIEMVALSLVSTVNPLVRLRESPTLQSNGQMKMTSDGSGTGGTFNSFFDVFVELTFDGGSTYVDPIGGALHLESSGSAWTTIEPGLLIAGLIGDQNANFHPGKIGCQALIGMQCVDFYLVGSVTEQHPAGAVHTARGAVPEPDGLALFGAALCALGWLRRRSPSSKGC